MSATEKLSGERDGLILKNGSLIVLNLLPGDLPPPELLDPTLIFNPFSSYSSVSPF